MGSEVGVTRGVGCVGMPQGEISGTLHAFLLEYEDIDRSVRLGSKEHGIIVGADHRSEKHNQLMYHVRAPPVSPRRCRIAAWRHVALGLCKPLNGGCRRQSGCPWREDPSDCSLPEETYPRAASGGLYNLQSAFLTSAKNILHTFGTTPDLYVNVFDRCVCGVNVCACSCDRKVANGVMRRQQAPATG